jgi:uncharacterized protein
LSRNTEQLERLQQICAESGVAALYVFGSRAQEVSRWFTGQRFDLGSSRSDVDIGVKAMTDVTWSVAEKVRLAVALEGLLGCQRVDLVVLGEVDPFVCVEVIRGERLYARNEYAADEYDLYVLRRAGDLAPLERERMALVLGERT